MKKTYLIFFFLMLGVNSFAQTLFPHWNKNLGGTQADVPICFEQLPDSGYIILASSSSNIGFDKSENNRDTTLASSDYWLIRLDAQGNKIWDKTYGGFSSDVPSALLVLKDGFLLGGTSTSGIGAEKMDSLRGVSDFWVVRTDFTGNQMWDRTVGGLLADQLTCMALTSNNYFVLGGWTLSGVGADKSSASFGDFDFWWVKLDSVGTFVLEKTLGGILGDNCFAMCPTDNAGVMMTGYSNSPISFTKSQASQGSYDYWVLEVDSIGRKIWDKTIGGAADDYAFSISKFPGANAGYLVGGFSFSGISGNKTDFNRGQDDYWLARINNTGSIIWDKTFGGNLEDEMARVMITRQNQILMSGTSYSTIAGEKSEFNLGLEQGWMVLCDTLGNKILDKTFFTTGHDEYAQVISDFNGCYTGIIYTVSDTGGYRTFYNNGGGDIWLNKLCPTPLGIDDLHNTTENFWLNYDAGSSILSISADGLIGKQYSLQIFNLNGALSFEESGTIMGNTLSRNLDISHFSSGMYLVKLQTEKGNYSKKFVKL